MVGHFYKQFLHAMEFLFYYFFYIMVSGYIFFHSWRYVFFWDFFVVWFCNFLAVFFWVVLRFFLMIFIFFVDNFFGGEFFGIFSVCFFITFFFSVFSSFSNYFCAFLKNFQNGFSNWGWFSQWHGIFSVKKVKQVGSFFSSSYYILKKILHNFVSFCSDTSVIIADNI